MEKKSYTAMPKVPPEIAQRYETVMAVLSGELSVSEGARRLDLSRNHFQTLMHRMQAVMIESLQPKAGGRPVTPEREKRLQRDLEKLQAENARLQRKVDTTDRILGVASGLLRGRIGRESRSEGGKGPAEDE
jgi:transposase-like protein